MNAKTVLAFVTLWFLAAAPVGLFPGQGLVAVVAAERTADTPAWKPTFFALCMDNADSKKRPFPDQLTMVRELGFDGVGYPLWLGEAMEKNLKALDDQKLQPCLFWTSVNVNPKAPQAYDPRLKDSLARLKGRGTVVCVLLQGLKPADPAGMDQAVKVLRGLGDLAAASDLRISIYHHTGDWSQSLLFALEVVKKADHPRVGVNFNLCHWLMIDGDKDYRPVLRENASRIFLVSLNGAKLGSKTWTNGLIQPLDKGDFDNLELLKLLKGIGYRGPIGLMCYGVPGDAREHMERSMKVWKEMLAKTG